MRNARIAGYRKIKAPRGTGSDIPLHARFYFLLLKGVVAVFPVIALVFLLSMPKTPHVLFYYTDYGSGFTRFTQCEYLGIHGKVDRRVVEHCPLILFLEEED